ncbi:MAG TPA: DUF3159 domain-containing protein [Amnibacterium sp.]|uniref:DUF3159 domain-containing protein n=1 Tax=Amnibacterium sp. TaxID=1872496 RepID=UPI002F94D008
MTDPGDPVTGLARAAQGGPLTARGLLAAIGGWLGVVESVLPPLLFVVLYQVAAISAAPHPVGRSSLIVIVAVPLAVSLLFVAYRAIRRQRPAAAGVGAGIVGVSAVLVLVSGDASTNYVPGFFINAVYGLAFLASLLVRRPLVGVAVAALTQRAAAVAAHRRLFAWLTLGWVALFAVRLAVELPLYFTHQIVPLGIARILTGVPLYSIVLIITVLGVQAATAARAPQPG